MRRSSQRLVLFFAVCVAAFCQQQPLKLSLVEAEHLALAKNPQIGIAANQAYAAAEVTKQARSAYQPTLFGSITAVGADSGSRLAAGGLNNPIVYNRVGAGVSISQLISDFGRTGSLVQSARLQAQSQEQGTKFTKSDVILQVDAAYYEVLRAKALLQVAAETIKARQIVADQVAALEASKLKSKLDLSFANVNLADAKMLLVTAENDVKSAEAELARSLGLPDQQTFDLVAPIVPPKSNADLNALIDSALQNRSDIAQQRLAVESSRKFTNAERALARPSVSLFGSAGFVPAGEAIVPGQFGAVGVNMNIPIFNGGLFKARRTEAEYNAAVAELRLRDLENSVKKNVRVAYAAATNAYERLDLSVQLLTQAKLAMDYAQSRYDLGLSSIVELSQSQLNLTSAEIAHQRAIYDVQTQLAVLRYQTGNQP